MNTTQLALACTFALALSFPSASATERFVSPAGEHIPPFNTWTDAATNIQAAMGCAQLELVDEYIQAKRQIANHYTAALTDISGLVPMREADWAFSVFWLYTCLIDPDLYGDDSRRLLQKLQMAGIQTRPLWQPMHLSPANKKCQSYYGDVAEKLNATALSLPCSVGLTAKQQQRVVDQIRSTGRSK